MKVYEERWKREKRVLEGTLIHLKEKHDFLENHSRTLDSEMMEVIEEMKKFLIAQLKTSSVEGEASEELVDEFIERKLEILCPFWDLKKESEKKKLDKSFD